MPIINKIIEVETKQGINIHNITPQIETLIFSTSIERTPSRSSALDGVRSIQVKFLKLWLSKQHICVYC